VTGTSKMQWVRFLSHLSVLLFSLLLSNTLSECAELSGQLPTEQVSLFNMPVVVSSPLPGGIQGGLLTGSPPRIKSIQQFDCDLDGIRDLRDNHADGDGFAKGPGDFPTDQ
jgi:hypothetical protein